MNYMFIFIIFIINQQRHSEIHMRCIRTELYYLIIRALS